MDAGHFKITQVNSVVDMPKNVDIGEADLNFGW
jgi:hypothetical protein